MHKARRERLALQHRANLRMANVRGDNVRGDHQEPLGAHQRPMGDQGQAWEFGGGLQESGQEFRDLGQASGISSWDRQISDSRVAPDKPPEPEAPANAWTQLSTISQ